MGLVGRGNMYGLERLYVWFGDAICLVGRGNVYGWER